MAARFLPALGALIMVTWTAQVSAQSWSYQTQAAWGTSFTQCQTAHNHLQSPIALEVVETNEDVMSPVQFTLAPTAYSPLAVVIAPRSNPVVSVSVIDGQVLLLGDEYFSRDSDSALVLSRIDVHAPAEHTIDDTVADVEVTWVFADDSGTPQLTVSQLFASSPTSRDAQCPLLAALPYAPLSLTIPPANVSKWLPMGTTSILVYRGTLTYPPCSPVNVVVDARILTCSAATIGAIKAMTGENAKRDAQSAGGRRVEAFVRRSDAPTMFQSTLAADLAQQPTLAPLRRINAVNDRMENVIIALSIGAAALLAYAVTLQLGNSRVVALPPALGGLKARRERWTNPVSVHMKPGAEDFDDFEHDEAQPAEPVHLSDDEEEETEEDEA